MEKTSPIDVAKMTAACREHTWLFDRAVQILHKSIKLMWAPNMHNIRLSILY